MTSAIPLCRNPKAFYNYHILAKVEVGLVLSGSEVKSLRTNAGRASIAEAFARVEDGEVFLHQMTIPPYEPASLMNPPMARKRKLLLARPEIRKLEIHATRKGHTLVPLALYFKNGYAKIELGLAQGKSRVDKRQAVKKKEMDREIQKLSRRR